LPPDLEAAYHDPINELVDCIDRHWCDHWDRATLLSALAALAVAKSDYDVAEAILILDDDIITRINAGEWGELAATAVH